MALQERIHSLETEYAVNYMTDQRRRKPGTGNMVETLKRVLAESHGLPTSEFLVNGSKFYHDVGHAEWALPECRSARELAAYDKAADHLFMHSVVPRADKILAQEGFDGRLVITKNNADPYGNTYGCHENYQMQRNADLLGNDDFLHYLAQCLIPFLVTRQILTGAGHLIIDRDTQPGQLRYELSQRSAFIQTVVSRDTTKFRPIFNLGREGESFAQGNFRRLHQILGDANLSGWATYIKLGSTGLMLRLIEDITIDTVPALDDPVEALRTISADLNGTRTVALQNGQQVNALDIQWMYYDLANDYLNVFGASPDDEDLMEAWGKALEDMERDPGSLRDRADWAIKKHMLDSFLEQHGCSFDQVMLRDRDLVTELQASNLRYHELSPEGLYHRLYPYDTLVSRDAITHAQENPPPYTRARMRGSAIRLGRDYGVRINIATWTELSIENERARMVDPLIFDHPLLIQWERPWESIARHLEENPDDKWLHFKLGKSYERTGRYHAALEAYQHTVDRDADTAVFLNALAHAHLLLGNYNDARKWYEKHNQLVTEGFQTTEQQYIGLGDVYRYLDELDKALESYRKAARSEHPAAAQAYASLAQVYLKRGEVQSAETYFHKALTIDADQLIAQTALGALLLARGERDAAHAHFEHALALSSYQTYATVTPGTARYLQAIAQIALGRAHALAACDNALTDQTTAAAGGIFLLDTLLGLLAQSDPPPPDIEAAREAMQAIVIIPVPPDNTHASPHPACPAWLRSAAEHPQPAIRIQAMHAMGQRLDGKRIATQHTLTGLLLHAAQHDSDPHVRRAALQSLAHPALRDTPLMDEVIACLHDQNPVVRWAAQTSLEQITLPGLPAARVTELHSETLDSSARDNDPVRWLEQLAGRRSGSSNDEDTIFGGGF